MKSVTNKRHLALICLCVVMMLVSTVLFTACSPKTGKYFLGGDKKSSHTIEILAGQRCRLHDVYDEFGDEMSRYNDTVYDYVKAGNNAVIVLIPAGAKDGRYVTIDYTTNKLIVYGYTYNKK